MSFDPKDFYHFAVWLSQQRTDEASFRTAISRTYYACHLLAVQGLVRKEWEPKGTGDDHGGVIRELRYRRTRNLADRLLQLREFREHADYHLEAMDTVPNRDCKFCQKARRLPSTTPLVGWHDWEEVRDAAAYLLPLLERL